MDLPSRLKKLRTEKGLTQTQVAAPKYSSAFVSQIEAGHRKPSDAALEHFSHQLGVSVDELVTGVPANFGPEMELELEKGWENLYLGKYEEADEHFTRVERKARPAGRSRDIARALVGRARCCERQGQTADAHELFTAALDMFSESPLPARAEAVAGIARCHQMSGNTRLAAHVLETYLLDLERNELLEPGALMRTYASLVWPYMELGLNKEAGEAAEKALQLQRRIDSPEEIAGMHLNVARVLCEEGRFEDALNSLKEAETIYEELNWRTELARAQTNRGMVFASAGKLDRARAELGAAVDTYREVGFVRGEARTLNEMASVERLLGNNKEAEGFARRALELLSDMEAKPELALAHMELAASVGGHSPAEAEKNLRRACEIYGECGENLHQARTHRLIGELYEAHPDLGNACDEFRKGLVIATADRS